MKGIRTNRVVSAIAIACALGIARATGGTVVRVERAGKGFQLTRDGKPYFIKGAGGCDSEFLMNELAAAGGNSIRIWSAREESKGQFDMAHAHGLTVCPTLWMGRDNNTPDNKGGDYGDEKRVLGLIEKARSSVLFFKDHPALLAWGVGNEMESPGSGSPELWKTVDGIAAMIHEVDPNHPTLTVIADLGKGGEKVKRIMQFCPHLDILGVNSYGGAVTLAERLEATGWGKPYIVTEFGANYLNLKKTAWGAKIEPTTTQRAAKLPRIYDASIAPGHSHCLGSYVFVWKQPSAFPGFHDCFMPSGERLGHVDAMTLAWTGKARKNRCPEMEPIVCDASGKDVAPGSPLTARVSAKDPDGDRLKTHWEVRAETTSAKKNKPSFENLASSGSAVESGGVFAIAFKAPLQPGAYRLFVTIADGAGNAACANVPFHVGGGERGE